MAVMGVNSLNELKQIFKDIMELNLFKWISFIQVVKLVVVVEISRKI